MRFFNRSHLENVDPPTLLGVPGIPTGEGLRGTARARRGQLFIVVPYGCPLHVDAHSEGIMKYLGTFGTRSASAA